MALNLYKAGLGVVPLTHPWDGPDLGKTAAVQWRRYRTRRATPQEVDQWWPEEPNPAHPLHNVGIITGPISGVVVLNLQTQHDKDEAARLDFPFPDRYVRTETGEHWYYGWDPANGLRSGVQVSGLTVIGENGYVVAPGSRHHRGLYEEHIERPNPWMGLAPLPEKLVKAVAERTPDHRPMAHPNEWPLDTFEKALEAVELRGAALTRHLVRTYQEAHKRTTISVKNDALYRAARDLVGLGVDPEVAEELLGGLAQYISDAYEHPAYPECERWVQEVQRELVRGASAADGVKPVTPAELREMAGAPLHLANCEIIEVEQSNGKIGQDVIARPAALIRAEMVRGLNGWPCTAGGVLFAIKPDMEPGRPDAVWWFPDPHSLFAWLHSVTAGVLWKTGEGRADVTDPTMRSLVTKEEFFRLLREYPAHAYDGIEVLPHYPQLPRTLYLAADLPVPDPSLPLWREWISMFNPETPEDLALLQAATLTPLWGGAPGTRPVFLFTSKHGRGSGKTSTAEAIAELYGGAITITPDNAAATRDPSKVLVAPSAMTRRVVLWDNLKGRTDSATIEALVTSTTVQGHRLFVGHTIRPNNLTWFVTANRAEVSSDLAQRAIPIEIGAPDHSVDYRGKVRAFLAEHRLGLIAEMLEILGPNHEPAWTLTSDLADRWQSWARGVLEKVPNGDRALVLVKRRRSVIDADLDDANIIVEVIAELVYRRNAVNSALSTGKFRFSTNELAKLAKALGYTRFNSIEFGRWLSKKINDGDLKHLTPVRVLSKPGSTVRGYEFAPGPARMREILDIPRAHKIPQK